MPPKQAISAGSPYHTSLAGVKRLEGTLLVAFGTARVRLQEARVAEEQERLDEVRVLVAAILRRLARELIEADGEECHTGYASEKDFGADADALRGQNVTTKRSHGILS